MKFKLNNKVYFTDIDNNISSGYYKIIKIISDEIFLISNSITELECFKHELR